MYLWMHMKVHATLQAPSVSILHFKVHTSFPKLPSSRIPISSLYDDQVFPLAPAILSPLSLILYLRLFCLLTDSPDHVQSASFSLCSGLSRVPLDVFSLTHKKDPNHAMKQTYQQFLYYTPSIQC